jgi:hypothetical protein
MTISLKLASSAALVLSLLWSGSVARAGAAKEAFGVYEYVLDRTEGTFEEASAAVQSALTTEGWRLLAKVDAGVPAGCGFKARVFAVVEAQYARKLMAANHKAAPFALVDRINVFEDESGLHVAILNAESVNRTVLMEDVAYAELSRAHVDALRALVLREVKGKPIHREFGEKRSGGYIGKTMGVMAGGPFGDKIKDEAEVASGDWKTVAERVKVGLTRPGGKWGLRLAYELELPEQQTMIFGSTGSLLESRSFSIVRAGADDTRDSLQCPGLAHAAAYPIEVVVAQDGAAVKVRLVDTMYRMKMYFEDAGKWAFMKNMGMPGSIHEELAARIQSGLGRP